MIDRDVNCCVGTRDGVEGEREVGDVRIASRRLHVMPPVVRDEEDVAGPQLELEATRARQLGEAPRESVYGGGVGGGGEGVEVEARSLVERMMDWKRVDATSLPAVRGASC